MDDVGWVALFSTLAGLIYGTWVDGASVVVVIFYLVALLTVLSGLLWWVTCKNAMVTAHQRV